MQLVMVIIMQLMMIPSSSSLKFFTHCPAQMPEIDLTILFNFILIYKLNIQIQISLMMGNLYLAGLITGISSGKNE